MNVQRVEVQRTTSNVKHMNVQRPRSNVQRPASEVQWPMCERRTANVKRQKSNVQRHTCERPASSIQRPTSNVEHSTSTIKIHTEIPNTSIQDTFFLEYFLVKTRFRRPSKEENCAYTGVSAHLSNTAAQRRDVAKGLAGPTQESRRREWRRPHCR